ncbi:hypothetical protein [Nonomuraea sp. NPDC001023]|uniref:hypothetical protein n=1 Tax=unclassified Nonomuraea TaxID=2593643 RepID=UPI00331E2E95
MRWRGKALDVLLVTAAIGFDVLTTWHTWGTASAPVVICGAFSVLAGAPMGFLRRWPVAVAGYLAALLVLTDQLGAFTVNTVQILLMAALGVVAHRARPLTVSCSALVVGVTTAVNLADPGHPFTANAWWYCGGAVVVPVLIGVYLRGPAGRLPERDVTPDVLLAGGGLTLAVLNTWTDWDATGGPVWGTHRWWCSRACPWASRGGCRGWCSSSRSSSCCWPTSTSRRRRAPASCSSSLPRACSPCAWPPGSGRSSSTSSPFSPWPPSPPRWATPGGSRRASWR